MPRRFELVDDLAERLGAGGVEHLDLGQAQDHDPDVADGGELGEEPLGGAEEQRAVEAVDDDVLGEQSVLRRSLSICSSARSGSRSASLLAGDVAQGERTRRSRRRSRRRR